MDGQRGEENTLVTKTVPTHDLTFGTLDGLLGRPVFVETGRGEKASERGQTINN